MSYNGKEYSIDITTIYDLECYHAAFIEIGKTREAEKKAEV
jgi:hypothetical protein